MRFARPIPLLVVVATFAIVSRAAPDTQPSTRDRQRAAQLSRRAADLIDGHKLPEAEAALRESLAAEPRHPTRLYNLACVLAGRGKTNEAMDTLEEAADAGFTDFTHLTGNPGLAAVRALPRFRALLDREPEVRHHAAELAIAALRQQLGEGYLFEADEERKLIFATNVDRATLGQLRSDLELQSASQWRQLFAHRPDEFIRVVVPSAGDFKRLVPSPHAGGAYDDTTRTLVVQHLGQFMTHEFTHALHAADQHAVGQEHAVWVSEGLASLYEAAEEEDGVLVPKDGPRLVPVRAAARRHTLIPLEQLLALSREDFNARAALAYGESALLLQYLFEQDLLRKFYDAYKAGYPADRTGRAAIEHVTGMTLSHLQQAWTDWVSERPETPAANRPDGPMLGLSLAEATDGLRVSRVAPGGPAAKAGVKADDVVVALDAREVRDRPSLNRALADHAPGEVVTVRVRRGSGYQEVSVTLGKRPAQPAER